jgi:hypothetical protein
VKNVSHEIYTSNPSQYDLSVANLTRHPNSSDSTLTSSSQKDSNSSSNHQRSRTISHGPSQSRSREQESARSRITSQPTRAGPSSRADSRPSTQTSPRKADVRSVSSPVPKTMDLHAPLADFPSTSPGGRVLSYEREQGSSTSKRDKHASIQPPSRQATSPYESSMAGSASVPNLNQILLSKGEKSPRAPFINPANAYSPHELSPSSSPRRDPISLASPAEEDYESTPGSTPGEDEEFVLAPSFEGKTPATERPPIIASSSVSPPRMTRELSGEGSLGMDEILRGFHGEPNGSLGLTNEVGRKLSESENGRAAVFLDQDETAQVQNVIERAQVAEPVGSSRLLSLFYHCYSLMLISRYVLFSSYSPIPTFFASTNLSRARSHFRRSSRDVLWPLPKLPAHRRRLAHLSTGLSSSSRAGSRRPARIGRLRLLDRLLRLVRARQAGREVQVELARVGSHRPERH